MMISHHEGTFAMAALEMQFGRDKIAQALADNAITSQKKELTFLKDWLGQQDLSIMKIVPQANQGQLCLHVVDDERACRSTLPVTPTWTLRVTR